jgi:hypothetical protein
MLFTHLPLTLDNPDSADYKTPTSQDLSDAEVAAIKKIPWSVYPTSLGYLTNSSTYSIRPDANPISNQIQC